MSIYSNTIQQSASQINKVVDPRHVEALMRLEYSTLDHLPKATFMKFTKMVADCPSDVIEELESLAKSYAL